MSRGILLLALLGVFLTGCDLFQSHATGTLEGRVTIGPICPVVRPGIPCPVPPEAYAAREVWIFQDNKHRATAKLDDSGRYSIALKPGIYLVDINHAGIDRSTDLPKEVRIQSGETTHLDIEIDTGIR
ncbi:hypothetical protein HY229_01285 [Candidatus Acetothermia bacterium]|nr:hypothetical protein [Candidatus Acetothermia bacterium]MBI3642722.1 hypothetical protein [Candidatus Acetothermia bacterium]